jgi:succinate dehydrogenase / fumarate reductase cytochrome b subunit
VSTVATAPDLTLPLIGGHRHFLLRRLHSLTGLVFGGYIVVHLLVNATLIQGGNVFRQQVEKIHSLPFLLAVEWALVFLPIIYHTIYGIWITFTGQPNVGHYGYTKNWFYFWQRVSAMVIVLFILFHVLAMKGFLGERLEFHPLTDPAPSVSRHFHAHWTIAYLIYPIGILASCYHLANGFWAAAITWGLTISAAAQRRWGFVCAGIFAFTLLCGLLAWFAAVRH